jgi:8-oxo-dGTP diphosphatase
MNHTELKTVEVVAAVIYDDEGRVLATQCAPHKHNGGWEFPGGKIEPGEDARDAVAREIQEELNVQVKVGQLIHTIEWDYPTFHLRMYCYACRILGGELQLREHVACRWLSKETLDTVNWLPADVDLLPHLFV